MKKDDWAPYMSVFFFTLGMITALVVAVTMVAADNAL